jgi:hypothetical protein
VPIAAQPPLSPHAEAIAVLLLVRAGRLRQRRLGDQPPRAQRLREAQQVADQLHRLTLAAYDRTYGLEAEHLAVDGCITKAPCGGQVARPSPVDRRKQGLERSVATDAHGVLLAATLDAAAIVRAAVVRPLHV